MDEEHHKLCQGKHYQCPYCNKKTCCFVVNIVHFNNGKSEPCTLSCLECCKIFNIETTKEGEDVACGLGNSSIPRKDKSLAYP